ncbi:S-adenosyl-L-methionine-dependent methyltransferase [Dacryopinax primogenitus]|uniref:S-adenosyl-L-methionine-dependent methyltransferase n=1 Tax=Dacryopinax primogenitus (strain DJM 731) TaxID=1858805 RepID=M5G1Q8_DACPD|nr:S-adenosyl-L-methionine-dependent methyltransferase [Dacryopinax primogenitus]EJT99811.1 S-adenosyl-L-methionine-dependent methyltransferase [Dacryopinax primogenitus]
MAREVEELDALLSLLTDAVGVVKSAYSAHARQPELEDAAGQPTQLGASEELHQARRNISSASRRTLLLMANSAFETAALRVAAGACVADHLLPHPSGLPITDLAAKCDMEADKLARVLRLLACKHVFREVAPGVFANTPLSTRLARKHGMWDLVNHITDECFKSSAYLYDALAAPVFKPPFAHAYKHDAGYWAYMAGVDKTMGARFGRAMLGVDMAEIGPLLSHFPWETPPPGTTVCDVGGGVGTVSLALANRFSQLKLVVQDTPNTLAQARLEWKETAPQVVSEGRVDFLPLDFLTQAPNVGCEYYYVRCCSARLRSDERSEAEQRQLKHVVHDWADEEAVRLLRNVRQSMGAHSRVLIHEFVIQPLFPPPTDPREGTTSSAPSPSLAPDSSALHAHHLDLTVLCLLGTKERTQGEFEHLARKAGLGFVRLWNLGE